MRSHHSYEFCRIGFAQDSNKWANGVSRGILMIEKLESSGECILFLENREAIGISFYQKGKI
jgi:hypothetical protein